MKIVTTPMCEKILKLVGINDYIVNKNPDEEDGDLAILLSESKVKMNSLAIKLNTFSQIRDSVIEVSKLNNENSHSSTFNSSNIFNNSSISNDNLISQKIEKIFSNYSLANEWIQEEKKKEIQKKNSNINIKVYSQFLRDIVEDMGFILVDSINNNFNYNSSCDNNFNEIDENNSSYHDNNFDFVVYPDYMENKLDINSFENKINKNIFISIPTHFNVSKDPIKRAEMRYSILNQLKK
ncbi:hypothetical protein ALNOE001_20600 [Candidatus Methanobinarius endosymbioticus]|uniref:Uncharacterized protein n=1 Tax=Candidatus Methanobinarius endosymbioticus TaxID=2006182 RepID=A0A366M9Z4_9EURY|nr:hypothetical protein ALNOE001_20600 [Candidatus Methanobinarius endosymbioticus]